MEDMNYQIRQEAAAIVINECRQWLNTIMEEEMEKIKEDIRHITNSRLKIEQIAAAFEEDAKRNTAEESGTIVTEQEHGLGTKKQAIKV